MENTSKSTMFQTSLTWGLITGFASIIYILILYFADLMTNAQASWITWIILVIGIYLGTKAFRDQLPGGYISYGRALGTGVMISLFYGILTAIFMVLLYTVIDADLINKVIAAQQEKMLEKGAVTEEQLEQGLEMGKKLFIPMVLISSLFLSVFFGTIISLITSAILKKEGDGFNRDMSAIKN